MSLKKESLVNNNEYDMNLDEDYIYMRDTIKAQLIASSKPMLDLIEDLMSKKTPNPVTAKDIYDAVIAINADADFSIAEANDWLYDYIEYYQGPGSERYTII